MSIRPGPPPPGPHHRIYKVGKAEPHLCWISWQAARGAGYAHTLFPI